MDNDMICKKIIPCLDLNNAVEMAKYYNDAGADEIAYFDSKATKDGREPNVAIIRQICDSVDIPLIACGGRCQEASVCRCIQGMYEICGTEHAGACH